MDINQMLPLLLKGKLGDREQTLLKLTQNPDPSALGSIITQMYEQQQKAPPHGTCTHAQKDNSRANAGAYNKILRRAKQARQTSVKRLYHSIL